MLYADVLLDAEDMVVSQRLAIPSWSTGEDGYLNHHEDREVIISSNQNQAAGKESKEILE